MPEAADDAYNARIERAFSDSLRDEDGALAGLLQSLRGLTARAIEVVAESSSVEETNQKLDAAMSELQARAGERVQSSQEEARSRMEEAHREGYAAAAAAVDASAPDWSPDASGVDPYARAPFQGSASGFIETAIEEEVDYLRQDLRYIRKYVSEDRYAKAVANVLAKGDKEIVDALARRGVDLNDFNAEDLQDRAAEIFRNTKTRGSVDIRGVLQEVEPDELAARRPQLWRRVKRNGTDALPRILDEVAKDLAAQSPATRLASWELSSRHDGLRSSPDECDFLAEQDLYGFGPGLYHPRTTPSHPHPNCECSVRIITADPSDWGRAQPERPDAFDIREDRVRRLLEKVEGPRTITDAHVERVARHARAVVAEVHSNPR